MKSKFLAIPLLVLPTTAIVTTTVSCGDIFPKSIEIIGQNVVFIEQEDVQYEAKIDPDVLSRDIYWTVDNESVAKIDKKGVLHPISPGVVTIRARVRSVISSVIGIKEVNVFYQPDAISIEGDQEAYIDRQTHYTATVTSTKGKTAQDVIWFLTDEGGQELEEDIATIDNEGWLNPNLLLRKDEKIVVNAKSVYNQQVVASKPVTITAPTPDYVTIDVNYKLTIGYPDSITLDENILGRSLEANWECDTQYLEITGPESGGYNYTVTPKELTTEETTIKGTSTKYGLSAETKVEIVNPPESITITGKSELHVGDTEPYTQRVFPSDAVQDVWWMFPLDHPEYYDYADIDFETGVVTAKKATEELDDEKITICAYSMVGEDFLIDPVAVGLFDIKIIA